MVVAGFDCAMGWVKKEGSQCGHGGPLPALTRLSGLHCMLNCEHDERCRAYTYSPKERQCNMQEKPNPGPDCVDKEDFIWCSPEPRY